MSAQDHVECPLCMEPLEMDDINFFPCGCGYQICRFCWHRIRTDENGLCPACRQQYPEDPAEFKALTDDELQRIKKERRHKDLQRKQKAAESRKHLANVRVVQRNLVFVVGLSPRLADVDVLKKHEYFGKFGKMHKVVINPNTSYAGSQGSRSSQGPSASAYVTYIKPEDALKAIQSVNNVHVDGRTLKASLGTTKYCSHFLRGTQCPKPDCMYLHELGEEAASFTKEEMQQGKHTEYEQKLYEQFVNSQNLSNQQAQQQQSSSGKGHGKRKTGSPTLQGQQQSKPQPVPASSPSPPQNGKEIWSSSPSSSSSSSSSSGSLPTSKPERGGGKQSQPTHKTDAHTLQQKAPGHQRNAHTPPIGSKSKDTSQMNGHVSSNNRQPGCHTNHNGLGKAPSPVSPPPSLSGAAVGHQLSALPGVGSEPSPTLPPHLVPHAGFNACFDNSNSLFSSNGFAGSRRPPQPQTLEENFASTTEIPDTLPVTSSTDWQAAFGFSSSSSTPSTIHSNNVAAASECTDDEDLGFDPWDESSKALADMIAKEASATSTHHLPGLVAPPISNSLHHTSHLPPHMLPDHRQQKPLPPGLSQNPQNHIGAFHNTMGLPGSKLLGLPFPAMVANFPPTGAYTDGLSEHITRQEPAPSQDWQEGLRALLPSSINLSFGAQSHGSNGNASNGNVSNGNISNGNASNGNASSGHSHQQQSHQLPPHKSWTSQAPADLSWDPAIVTSGQITDNLEEPHWMASLHHLTEEPSRPYVPPSAPLRAAPCWPTPANTMPPPGFHQNQQLRAAPQVLTPAPDSHKLDGLQ